jgi:hypothetical protein
MAQKDFLFDHHIVPAFVPVADAFTTGITTEAVSLKNYRKATLVIITGAIQDTGVSNILTIEACTTAAGGTTDAIPFHWRVQQYSTTVDLWSELTLAADTGYNFSDNNTVANAVWMAEVLAADVAAAVDGASFVRAAIAETADKTITAGGIWILSEPRYCGDVPQTAIA